jgi:hypothetical protein
MRPIAAGGDQPVLDRIDIIILHAAAEILIVADQVFPAHGFRTGTALCATLIAPYGMSPTALR